MTIETLTRPCVREVTPYFPGKPIAEVQRELGIKKVFKLASNENFLGPSPKALKMLRHAAKDCHLYPEGASPLLRQAIARHLKISDSQVLVGNGSDEIIRLLCEAFLTAEDEVVASQYAFIRFKQQAMLMGAKVIEVPMDRWTHDLSIMSKTASPRTKMVFIASPNNPTGTYNTRDQVIGLLNAVPKTAIVVLDEAYCHFADQLADYPDSVGELLPKYPNLVVVRTFSKAYGLAGIRLGFGVADAELVSWLDRIRMPFNVSLPAQRAGIEALKDSAFLRKSVSLTDKSRKQLLKELRALGLEVGESASNFVFVKSPMPGRALFKRLLQEGVIIRPLDEYGLKQHVRISVGAPAANRALFRALKLALSEGAQK